MHDSALESFTNFKNTYLDPRKDKSISVVEIGSLAVNSSIKNIAATTVRKERIPVTIGKIAIFFVMEIVLNYKKYMQQ